MNRRSFLGVVAAAATCLLPWRTTPKPQPRLCHGVKCRSIKPTGTVSMLDTKPGYFHLRYVPITRCVYVNGVKYDSMKHYLSVTKES